MPAAPLARLAERMGDKPACERGWRHRLTRLGPRSYLFWSAVRRSAICWNEHNAMRLAAALAFYSVLSLAPLVLLTISLTGLVIGVSTAQHQLLTQVQSLLGAQGEMAVRAMLANVTDLHASSIASVIGLATLLFSASQVFAELHSALNLIWQVPRAVTSGLIPLIRERFLSFGLVLSIGLLLLVSLVLSAALAALGDWTGTWLPLPVALLRAPSFLVSLAGITALFALIFKYVPQAHTPWRPVWIGAFLTACLFDIGKALIGLYLGKASVSSTYGAAGSLVAMVIWVYYSSLIFFFGAEFTHVLAERYSKRSIRARQAGDVLAPAPRASPGARQGQRGQPSHASRQVTDSAISRDHTRRPLAPP
jgi:membrane protein